MSEQGPTDFELQLVNLTAVVEAKERHGQRPSHAEHAQLVKLHDLLGKMRQGPFIAATIRPPGQNPEPDIYRETPWPEA